jgi:hypothetical protein
MGFGFMSHFFGCRGQQGLPGWVRWLPGVLVEWVAQRRRTAGWYDARTLALFRLSWLRRRNVAALLGYLMFRRDLGLNLPRYYVPLLAQGLQRLHRRKKRMALDLLAEVGGSPLDHAADQHLSEAQTNIRTMQASWREEFAQWLQQQGAGGICVVGNGGKLLGAGLGLMIDEQAVVVRFNLFRGSASTSADIGERVDVWVTAPGFDGAVPKGVQWVVVTGPDMAFKLRDWLRFEGHLRTGAKVLTVPLEPWRALVVQIQAPPSAGLLFLAWVRTMMGTWAHVQTVGFGGLTAVGVPYHHADANHPPASRHHWSAERTVLQCWQQEGLILEAIQEEG